jgi:hypothetical protein
LRLKRTIRFFDEVKNHQDFDARQGKNYRQNP